jgi:hypothetical protein
MTRDELISELESIGADDAGLAWVKETPGEPKELYEQCLDGEYLVMLANVGMSFDVLTWAVGTCREQMQPATVQLEQKLQEIDQMFEKELGPLQTLLISTALDSELDEQKREEVRKEFHLDNQELVAKCQQLAKPYQDEFIKKGCDLFRSLVPWEKVEAGFRG